MSDETKRGLSLPGTYGCCMRKHYYALTRGDEECPVCAQLAAKEKHLAEAIAVANEQTDEVIELEGRLDSLTAELAETFIDESGTVWRRPTAWAYAQTCRALHVKEAELSALRRDKERLRNRRQSVVAKWCADAFGLAHAASIEQRAMRLLEEAIEAYQASCCGAVMAHRLVDYVFASPRGTLNQEIGGVGITLLALANAAGLSADDEEQHELERVLSKPLEYFTKRNQVKNRAGFEVAAMRPAEGEDSHGR